jgi:D-3-phosphoglycerate dehydrogenase
MKKVLLLENIDQAAHIYFQQAGYEVIAVAHALSEAELVKALVGIEILGIRSKTKVTKRVIRAAKQLRVVGAFCIGTDQIDLQACQEHNIAVFNAPFSNTRSVAELALGEIIMLFRHIFEKSSLIHQGVWQKSAKGSHEIRGKTLGIIGYGNIGSQLSVLAECLGMRVCYYDLVDVLPVGNAKKCTSMEDVFARSDVVSVHVDGRKENHGLITETLLRHSKQGALFLNLSRGKVVDLSALAACLQEGIIAGAAIDVFPEEPEKNGEFVTVLQNLPNVILTPHIAGSTEEAQADIGTFVARKLVAYAVEGETDLAIVIPKGHEQ